MGDEKENAVVKRTFYADGMPLEIEVSREEAARLDHIDRNPHLYGEHHVDLSCCTSGDEPEDYEEREDDFSDPSDDEMLNGICPEADHFWETRYLTGYAEQRERMEEELKNLHQSRFPNCPGSVAFVTDAEGWGPTSSSR